MTVEVREVNNEELDHLVKKGKVLVDFYSKTCGPCKMLGFVLIDVAKSVDGVDIVTVDFDANKETAERYGVESYPTMIVFRDGQEVNRIKGLQQKPKIIQMIG